MKSWKDKDKETEQKVKKEQDAIQKGAKKYQGGISKEKEKRNVSKEQEKELKAVI